MEVASRLRFGRAAPQLAQTFASATPPTRDQWTRLVASDRVELKLASMPRRALWTARAIASARVSPLPVERRSRESPETIQNGSEREVH